MAGTFSLEVSRFVAKAQGRADVVLRKLALEMFTRVIRRSPVDTGRFRANWMSSVAQIDSTVTAATDKSGGVSVTRAATTVGAARAGDRIFLANSLPYARRLEYGWSRQAPAGMVRVTLQEFRSVVEGSAREAGGS